MDSKKACQGMCTNIVYRDLAIGPGSGSSPGNVAARDIRCQHG